VKFPGTKKEFDAWWAGKKDDVGGSRCFVCPLARFLRFKGFSVPSVHSGVFRASYESGYLPKWAQRYMMRFDAKRDDLS